MPQLVPFYFINEVTFTFAFLAITVYMLSKYIFSGYTCCLSLSSAHKMEENIKEIRINSLYLVPTFIIAFLVGISEVLVTGSLNLPFSFAVVIELFSSIANIVSNMYPILIGPLSCILIILIVIYSREPLLILEIKSLLFNKLKLIKENNSSIIANNFKIIENFIFLILTVYIIIHVLRSEHVIYLFGFIILLYFKWSNYVRPQLVRDDLVNKINFWVFLLGLALLPILVLGLFLYIYNYNLFITCLYDILNIRLGLIFIIFINIIYNFINMRWTTEGFILFFNRVFFLIMLSITFNIFIELFIIGYILLDGFSFIFVDLISKNIANNHSVFNKVIKRFGGSPNYIQTMPSISKIVETDLSQSCIIKPITRVRLEEIYPHWGGGPLPKIMEPLYNMAVNTNTGGKITEFNLTERVILPSDPQGRRSLLLLFSLPPTPLWGAGVPPCGVREIISALKLPNLSANLPVKESYDTIVISNSLLSTLRTRVVSFILEAQAPNKTLPLSEAAAVKDTSSLIDAAAVKYTSTSYSYSFNYSDLFTYKTRGNFFERLVKSVLDNIDKDYFIKGKGELPSPLELPSGLDQLLNPFIENYGSFFDQLIVWSSYIPNYSLGYANTGLGVGYSASGGGAGGDGDGDGDEEEFRKNRAKYKKLREEANARAKRNNRRKRIRTLLSGIRALLDNLFNQLEVLTLQIENARINSQSLDNDISPEELNERFILLNELTISSDNINRRIDTLNAESQALNRELDELGRYGNR